MNWKNAVNPMLWTDIAREKIWKATTAPDARKPASPLSWQLDTTRLASTVIRWPRTLAWQAGEKWMRHVRTGLAAHVSVEEADIPQPDAAIAVIELVHVGETHRIVIDYHDFGNYRDDLLKSALIYFKMQFPRDGYPGTNIKPGGFVPNDPDLYNYLPRLRKRKDTCAPTFDVYGRFGLGFATEARRKRDEGASTTPGSKLLSFRRQPAQDPLQSLSSRDHTGENLYRSPWERRFLLSSDRLPRNRRMRH
jgi:hypothetical protein